MQPPAGVLRGAVLVVLAASSPAALAEVPGDMVGETFCDCFQLVHDNVLLGMLGEEYQEFIALLHPGVADINGATWVETDPETSFSINGNGMLDCSAELKLLEAALTDVNYDLNGVTHADVVAAWDANDAQFSVDCGTVDNVALWPTLKTLGNGLPQIMKGLMIVGDGWVDFSVEGRITCDGSAGFVGALMFLLGDSVANPEIDLDSYVRLPEFFGEDGNADGDPCTNREEFDGAAGDAAYVLAALDAGAYMPGCGGGGEGEGEGEGEPRIEGRVWLEEGDALDLRVRGATLPATFSWRYDGNPVGTSSSRYWIPIVTTNHAGAYSCDVVDASKAAYSVGPVVVMVEAPGSMPVGALGGLAAALACAATGVLMASRLK